jgi:hypothetical protein
MKTELAVAGLRLNMRSRFRRRVLVLLVYAGLAALFAGSWYVDRWGVSAAFALVFGLIASRGLLGGFDFHGLVRPFNPAMGWRYPWPVPKSIEQDIERECHNDERDIRFRDRAHYYSHRVLSILFIIVWAMAFAQRGQSLFAASFERRFHMNLPNPHGPTGFIVAHYNVLIYGFVLILVSLSQTLPQALIVWHEPDMDEGTYSGTRDGVSRSRRV